MGKIKVAATSFNGNILDTKSDILLIKSSTDLLSKYVDLYKTCFPNASHLELNYLTWLYKENPAGVFVGADAFVGNDVVGQVAAIPCEYILRGNLVRGLLAVNVVVHPMFQGRHLFKKLGLKMCELGAEEGYDFVMGVANAAATPGWKRQMGFQLVTPLDAMIGFGRLGVNDYDSILGKAEFRHSWSPSTFKWRCGNPVNKVITKAVARNNSLSAFSSSGKIGIAAYAEVTRDDLLDDVKNRGWKYSLQLRVFLGLIPGHAFGSNYIKIPSRFRASPLNLIYKNLHDSSDRLLPDSCLVNYLDFDAF